MATMKQLVSRRERAGISQRMLARVIGGVSSGHLRYCERGERKPSQKLLNKMEQALNRIVKERGTPNHG